jgi:WD40 repeat protein
VDLARLINIVSRERCAQIVVGTKNGEMLIYDLASASLVDTVKAHAGTLWSMHIRPDGRGLVTGGADKDVKFWDIEERRVNEDDVCQCLVDQTASREPDFQTAQITNDLVPNPHQDAQND